MQIQDFYIKEIHGKDLRDLEKALFYLPENFISLDDEKIISLELKYTPKNEKGKKDVQIRVCTHFPEEIRLNIPTNHGIKQIPLYPGEHFDNSEHNFYFEGTYYKVSNTYESIIPIL